MVNALDSHCGGTSLESRFERYLDFILFFRHIVFKSLRGIKGSEAMSGATFVWAQVHPSSLSAILQLEKLLPFYLGPCDSTTATIRCDSATASFQTISRLSQVAQLLKRRELEMGPRPTDRDAW